MAGRNDRVPRPVAPSGWTFKFASRDAAEGYEQVITAFPGPTCTAWDAIVSQPRAVSDRQHRLRGSLGSRQIRGLQLEQWQYEVSGASRLWYAIDDELKTIWLVMASVGHPKATE